jgi:hypothetical protein
MNRTYGMAILIILLTSLLSSVSCGGEKVESRYRDREIVIDGNDAEWRGCDQLYDEDSSSRLAVINDEEYIYLCLTTWDRRTQQKILAMGLTVWFDAGGGEARNFGVQYPVKKDMEEMRAMRESRSRDVPEMLDGLVERSKYELEIISDEYGRERFSIGDGDFIKGIEAMLGMRNAILICEMKVPIGKEDSGSYAIGATADREIGLGFETGEFDTEEMRSQMGDRGKPPGGMGGRRGGRGGGMGGRGGMGQPGMGGGPGSRSDFEPLEVWMNLTLAAGDD